MKKIIITAILLFLVHVFLFAQTEKSYVINAGGGNLQTGTIGLTYFIGDHIALGQSMSLNTLDNIEVYPNPVKSILYLKIPNEQVERVQVYNVNGVILLDKKLTGIQLNFSEFPAGIYLLKFRDAQEFETNSIKIIKQ